MIDYKTAEKIIEDNNETKELINEAQKKKEEEDYKSSIHCRVEKLMLLVSKIAPDFPKGRWNEHKLESMFIKFDYNSDWFRLKLCSTEIIKKRKWFFLRWDDPSWSRRIHWYGRGWRSGHKDKASYFYKGWFNDTIMSEVNSLKLLKLVEKEVFDYILKKSEENNVVLGFDNIYCSQCGFSMERDITDKYCPDCGNKFE